MRILLTGAAGFIGAAIDAQLTARGDEVVRVDALIPEAHGSDAVPGPDVQRLDVRDAAHWADLLDDIDVVCHQAAMVGAGVTVADLPSYAAHNDLGTAALLAAMHERGVDALVLASSMVVYGEGRYACTEHGEQQPPARSRDALEAGDFENHCALCGAAVDLAAGAGGRAARPAQQLRRQQARAGALHARVGPAGTSAGDRAEVPQRLRPRDAARHPLLRRRGDLPVLLENGKAPRVFEDGGQMRDFVHVDDVARSNLLAIDAVTDRPAESWAVYNVCSGTPVPILRVAELLSEAAAGPSPEVTGDYRPGDVRHIVASPELASSELGFTAEIKPEQGIRAFATAPLRR